MRKISFVMIFIMILSGLLTGCGKSDTQTSVKNSTESSGAESNNTKTSDTESQNKQPVEIKIWHDKEEQIAAVLQKELDKLAPEVVVTLEKKEGLTDALKLVGNDPKSAPDMYLFAHDKIGVYAEMGILSPITDFIPKETLDSYVDMTIKASTYKDNIYQLPLYFETLLFMYNKEFMNENEVPTTTEELYQYMKENKTDDRYGFVEQHSTAYYSVPWVHAFQGEIINVDGTCGLDLPQTIKALNYHKKFVKYMPGESDYNTVNILFMNGKADSIIGGPWLVPSVRAKNIDLGFAKMPVVDETGIPLSPYSGVQGLHVLKAAGEAKSDAITKILTSLTNPDIGIAMANASGCAPANELCYENETVKQDEMVMTMRETAENAIPMPNIPEMDVMWSVTDKLLVNTYLKDGNPEEEAVKAQKEAVKLIEAMK